MNTMLDWIYSAVRTGGLHVFVSGFGKYMVPLLALLVLERCARSMLTFRKQPEIWAWLNIAGEATVPITHWENMIGRAKSADIVINLPTISRSHAVLTRYDDDSWTISDVGSRGGVSVNGKEVTIKAIRYHEPFELNGLTCCIEALTPEEIKEQRRNRTKAGKAVRPGLTLLMLTIFQLCCLICVSAGVDRAALEHVFLGFAFLMEVQWMLFLFFRVMGRTGYEVETIAFFLCTIGLMIIASKSPTAIKKELIAGAAGLFIYVFLGFSLRSLDTAKKLRYLAAAAGAGLLLVNLVFGEVLNGARNWISIGSFSFQPSELVKVCFVLVGASTLDRIVSKRNLFLFIVYSGFICACLALMSDFGSALIFFSAFLVIAFLRSGDFAGLALICAGTGFAGTLVLRFRPYVLSRFAAWGHVWEYANESGGYQQTRSMMCIASGGLFGIGTEQGFLKYVAASDTDLVFAMVSEEWGLLLALLMTAAIIILTAFVVRCVAVPRSTFYTIAACAAVSILSIQTILNVFGTVDLLPLTGVTFPFVSNGGSSMMASWGLLAFVKAADTRQNASFAIRLRPSVKEGGPSE